MTSRPLWWKRSLDLLVVAAVALPAAVVGLVLAAAVRITLGSPVLFVQERQGYRGRSFRLVKFRTMTDARGPDGALRPDRDRLSRFGRWLRSTSLDELPELWNVLRGEMSLVGPRPLLLEYIPLYDPTQARRMAVPPGLTGWAQINGRNAISWDQRFRLDVWYLEHASLSLDLKILAATVGQVIARRGVSQPGHSTMERFHGNV